MPRVSDKYADIFSALDTDDFESMLTRAVYYQCLKIKVLRENDRQLSFGYLGKVESWDEFRNFCSTNMMTAAEFYFAGTMSFLIIMA